MMSYLAIRLPALREHGDVDSTPRGRLALAGAVTALCGVVAADVLTHLLNARATPIQLVAEVVIVKTPGPVAESLIHIVGRNDKPFLVAGVTVAILLLGALAGLLAGRRQVYGHLVFLAMAGVALLAAMTRPDFTPYDLLPLVIGLVVWLVLLGLLTNAARPQPSIVESRRRFLTVAGGVGVAAIALGVGGRLLGRSRQAVEAARRGLRLSLTRGTVPAGAQTPLPGLAPWRVPNADFYRIDTALVLPSVAPDDWRLRIHGMVDKEIHLTYRQPGLPAAHRDLGDDLLRVEPGRRRPSSATHGGAGSASPTC